MEQNITVFIKQQAINLGFISCGIAKAQPINNEKANFLNWLKKGYQADMHYLENHLEKRLNPALLLENSKSIVVVLLNYFPSQHPQSPEGFKIAKYAYGIDYHFIIREKLNKLLALIKDKIPEIEGKAFTDSAPIFEKVWAQKAGLGWKGKNSMFITRQNGSFTFIGELLVNIELEYDIPETKNYCGTCTKCIDACPTKAIVEPGVIDANKCISYNTIENKDTIPEKIAENMQGWIFGCDICQDVCPWNNKSKPHEEESFRLKNNLNTIHSEYFMKMNEKEFKENFTNSPIFRTKLKNIQRNIKAATKQQ
jgi:epoxyqueuosine reductase